MDIGPFIGTGVQFEKGKKYTYSMYIKSNRTETLATGCDIGSSRTGRINANVTDEWRRFTCTFKLTDSGSANFVFYNNSYPRGFAWNDGDTIEVHSLEMREGDSLNTKTETKLINSELGTLLIPKREGYTFDGWYTSPAGGEKITSQTRVTENTTYYAHWIYNN